MLALQSITRGLWWKARRPSWTRGMRGKPENLHISSLEEVKFVWLFKQHIRHKMLMLH